MSFNAMAQITFQALPAGPAPTAPRSSRATIAELTRKLEAKHQANLAARDEQRRQQQRAEELERNRKREREASPTLDLPQKKPASELQITKEQSDGGGSTKLAPSRFQTGVNLTNDGRGLLGAQKLIITEEYGGQIVSFPALKQQLKPRNVPCSIALPGGLCIGSTQKRSDGWMVSLRVDGGYRGDPSLDFIFVANLRKGKFERVSRDPKRINQFVLRWYPGSVHRASDGNLASQHPRQTSTFTFGEPSSQDQPPADSLSGPPEISEGFEQQPMMVFSLTDASLSLEGTPISPTWQRYGDVKDVIDELTSGQQCSFTVTIGRELYAASRYATQMLWDAYQKRFRPLFTYDQQTLGTTSTLDLRLRATIKEIGDILDRHLPSAKIWKDGVAGDTKWTPVQFFDLPKHLDSLLRLGIRVSPEDTGDKSTGKPDQGSLGAIGPEKVVEEAEEGSEEGEILG